MGCDVAVFCVGDDHDHDDQELKTYFIWIEYVNVVGFTISQSQARSFSLWLLRV